MSLNISVNSSKPEVVHLIVSLENVFNYKLLRSFKDGKDVMTQLLTELNLNVIGEVGCQHTSPNGYANTYLLTCGHVSIHTHSEQNTCYIDFFSYKDYFNPIHAIKLLKTAFQTTNVNYQLIAR